MPLHGKVLRGFRFGVVGAEFNHNINVSQNNVENAYFSIGTAPLYLTTPSDVWLVIRQAIEIVKWSVSVGIEPTETAATPG